MEDEMSFETLFESLMREKNREELLKLDPDFFDEGLRFIASEESLVHPSNHVGFQRVRNLRNMLRELYSRREQKIIRLATMSSRGSAGQIDRAAMLDYEKHLFTELTQILEQTRRKRLEGPPADRPAPRKPTPEPEEPEEETAAPPQKKPETPDANRVDVVFTTPVQKVMGEELEPYGPYDEGDSATLPRSIAEILVQKGQAKIR